MIAESEHRDEVANLAFHLKQVGFGKSSTRIALMILDLGLERLDDLRPHHRREALSLPNLGHKTWDQVAKALGFDDESCDLDPPTRETAQTLLDLGWSLVPPQGWQGWRPARSYGEPGKPPRSSSPRRG